MKRPRHTLVRDTSGSVAVEFAILAPFLIALLLGVFQIGLGMQNYNALRSASADTARAAVVLYQKEDRKNDAWLTTRARTIATSWPYRLSSGRLTVTVSTPATQRVAGVVEKSINMQYDVPSFLGVMGMDDITIQYQRPVFLLS